jgi:hypothetical protein
VSNLGFFTNSKGPVTAGALSELKSSFDESLYPNFLAAQVFAPPLKDVAGSSYSITSGGAAHMCFMPTIWPATLKNAALNGTHLPFTSLPLCPTSVIIA